MAQRKASPKKSKSVVERWAASHEITAALEALARSNALLDDRDRHNLSTVGNYIALLAAGLAAPEARGVLARMTRELRSQDVLSAREVKFVSTAMQASDKAEAAQDLVFWLSMKVSYRWRSLSVPRVAELLANPGRKGPVAVTATLRKMLGTAGDEKQIAKNLDKARAALLKRR